MIKARGKRKEVPPPDDETKAQYEACRARVELPSHLRRATNNPANAGSKRSTPSRRTPRISKRSSGATRRPSRLSSRPSDAPLAARRLATVPCYDRERAASLREGDAASGGATRRRKSPFWKQTHFTRRGRAARILPPMSPQVRGPTRRAAEEGEGGVRLRPRRLVRGATSPVIQPMSAPRIVATDAPAGATKTMNADASGMKYCSATASTNGPRSNKLGNATRLRATRIIATDAPAGATNITKPSAKHMCPRTPP